MQQRIKEWWSYCSEDKTELLPASQKRQARLLSLMVSMFAVCMIVLALYLVERETLPAILRLRLVTALMLSIAYLVSLLLTRRGRIKTAAMLMVIAMSLLVHFQINIDFLPHHLLFYKYLVVPAIFCSLFFSTRTNIIFGSLNLLLMLAFTYPHGADQILQLPFGFLVVAGSLLLITSHHRDQLEKERQKELMEHAARLEALQQAGLRVAENLELETVLQQLLNTSLEISPGASLARIYLVEQGEIVSGITMQADDQIMEEMPWPRADGFTMQIVKKGREILVTDLENQDIFVYPNALGSMAGLPMSLDGQVVGVMIINYPEPRKFEADELITLRMLSDQAALAVRNVRLYESEREQKKISLALASAAASLNRSLELKPTLDAILEQVTQVFGCDAANIMLVDNFESRVTRVLGYSDQEAYDQVMESRILENKAGNLEHMIATGECVIIPDTSVSPVWDAEAAPDWVRSYAGAPLRVGDNTIGFLNLDSSQVGFIQPEMIKVLKAFASHAAIAVYNASLFQSEKEAHERTEAIYEVLRASSSSLDIAEVLDVFLRKSAALLPYTTSSIIVYAQDEPYLAAMVGLDNKVVSDLTMDTVNAILRESALVRRVKESRQPIMVNDTSKEPDWIITPKGNYINSWMGIPLIIYDEVIGILSIDSVEVNAYRQEHLRVGELLASEVATAINNARLYKLTQQHSDDLEQRVAERTAELKQSNEALEDFVFSVTHDLRAPLRAMEGYALALIEDYGEALNGDGMEYARSITGSAHQLDQLIQGLLEYSRLSKVEIYHHDVDLDSLLADVCRQMDRRIEEKQAEVVIDSPLPPVYAHQFTLHNMVVNLIDNALKFVKPGVKPQLRIWAEQVDHKICLYVKDNGIGIQAKDHERIFHVFERLHGLDQYPGSGLGLAIVHKSAERMGGRVGVESELDQGSCFWIELKAPPRETLGESDSRHIQGADEDID